MADDSDNGAAAKLPPKLNLRKQGVLKKESAPEAPPAEEASAADTPAAPAPAKPLIEIKPPSDTPKAAEPPAKQQTARLVVKPATEKPTPKPTLKPIAKTEAEADETPETKTDEATDSKADEAPAKDEPLHDPALAAAEKEAADATPSIKLKPLKPKLTPKASAAAPKKEPAEDAPAEKSDTKRKTSRIPLDSARTPEGDTADTAGASKPKTIKIKPAAPTPKIGATQALSINPPHDKDAGDKAKMDAAKRQTSRIPLEEALTADKETEGSDEPVDPARPKTIKIKRPGSDATTIKAKKPDAPKAGDSEMNKTARLDQLPMDDPASSPTQKKTIRVKRPDAASTVTPAAPRPGLGLQPPEPIEAAASDEPGVVWAILSLAASLVLCVVIYMLAAQAWGPNISGTALSSWTGGPNLSWPGKIMNAR